MLFSIFQGVDERQLALLAGSESVVVEKEPVEEDRV